MLAWKTCLKRLLMVASSNGPSLAATRASSISCSRTGSYCEAPLSVCRAPMRCATSARLERRLSSWRLSSSMSARRLWIFSSMVHPSPVVAPLRNADYGYGQFVKDQQGYRHQREVERVARGCENGRAHQAYDDGPAAVLHQRLVPQQADAGEEEAEHRHLEHDAEDAHQHEQGGDVAPDGEEALRLAPQEGEQHREGERQHHVVGESHAGGERQRGEEDERHRVTPLLLVEPRRHEAPHLPQ